MFELDFEMLRQNYVECMQLGQCLSIAISDSFDYTTNKCVLLSSALCKKNSTQPFRSQSSVSSVSQPHEYGINSEYGQISGY